MIIPVKIATPDADGKVFHVVEAGQSFWAIAIAYHITIHDLEVWNNLSRGTALQPGQRLFIPGANTEGYATPTPVGMVVPSPSDPDGRIVRMTTYTLLVKVPVIAPPSFDGTRSCASTSNRRGSARCSSPSSS